MFFTPQRPHSTTDSESVRVLIAAGGTAGHLAPSLAVAHELRRYGCEVTFAASAGRQDAMLIQDEGFDVDLFSVEGLPRRLGWGQLRAIVRAMLAVLASMRIVYRRRPNAVLAGGGFVSAPAAVAAWLLRVPVIATEADAHLGLANRISARVSKRLCTAYPLSQHRLQQEVVGRPVSTRFVDLYRQPDGGRHQAREELKIPHAARVLLVFGGSGGATRLNEATFDAWHGDADPKVQAADLYVLHVTGRRDFPKLRSRGAIESDRYRLIEYSDELYKLISASDLIVSRPGGSVFELAAIGRACVLVPSPHVTADHQSINAQWFARASAAVIARDDAIDARYLKEIANDLLSSQKEYERERMQATMHALARPDAAKKIACIVMQCARAHARRRSSRERKDTNGTSKLLQGRSFHLLGVGGAGVSALAMVCRAWGAHVSACDQSDSDFAQLVRDAGVNVQIGHDAEHINSNMEVVASSALAPDHPELARARELGCEIKLRGELLGELTRLRPDTVVVAGAHGKSTTTGMLATASVRLGLDPAVALGAVVPGLEKEGVGDKSKGTNVLVGDGPFFVEGDESDRTLLHLSCRVAVVTNIERDHHHTFTSDEQVERLFAQWIREQRPEVLVAGPGKALDRLAATAEGICRVVRYGSDDEQINRISSQLSVPGRHNALNALAALRALQALDCTQSLSESEIIEALGEFRGVGRRFEQHGEAAGVLVVDDYAHHPTEVAATITAAKELAQQRRGRVLVAFQPHLYSRTQALSREFALALSEADRAWVLPIYGAREQPIDGVSERSITDVLVEQAPLVYAGRGIDDPAKGDPAQICDETRSGDVLITMGAGSITKLAPRLVSVLASRANVDTGVPSWIEKDYPLADLAALTTEGTAQFFTSARNESELQRALAWARNQEIAVVTVTGGSQLLVDDRGFDGLVIQLDGELCNISINSDQARVVLGGGALLDDAAQRSQEAGISGLEFAALINASVDSAVRFKLGVAGNEIKDMLLRGRIVSATGVRDVVRADLEWGHEQSSIACSEVVSEIELALSQDEPSRIRASMPNSESTSIPAGFVITPVFLDPQKESTHADAAQEAHDDGRMLNAGELVKSAGLAGYAVEGVRISAQHGNVIEGTSGASLADVTSLVKHIHAAVHAKFGMSLAIALRILGPSGYRPLVDEDNHEPSF